MELVKVQKNGLYLYLYLNVLFLSPYMYLIIFLENQELILSFFYLRLNFSSESLQFFTIDQLKVVKQLQETFNF
jgi:hypothetical protein